MASKPAPFEILVSGTRCLPFTGNGHASARGARLTAVDDRGTLTEFGGKFMFQRRHFLIMIAVVTGCSSSGESPKTPPSSDASVELDSANLTDSSTEADGKSPIDSATTNDSNTHFDSEPPAEDSANAPTVPVEAYGTFECMGVIVDVPAGVDAASVGQVRVFLQDKASWFRVQDAVRVGAESYFASSLFNLSPGTSYTVKVELYNSLGALLGVGTATGSTRAEPSLPAPAQQLYVSPAGHDGASGTAADPFATVAQAALVATSGATIYLRAGTYHEGEVEFAADGTATAPIVLRAFQGEQAVLDGSDAALIHGSWTDLGTGLYSHPLAYTTLNITLVRDTDGVAFRAYPMNAADEVATQASEGLAFSTLNIDAAYHTDGTTLTLRIPGGTISDYSVYVAQQTTGILLDGRSFVTVDGIGLAHYGQDSFGRGVYVRNSSDITIQGCNLQFNNSGIWIKGDSNRVVIQDNTIVDDTADWHFTYTKSQGVAYHNEVETGLAYVDATYGGRGLVVRRNRIKGMFDGSHLAPQSAGSGRTAETEFYDNVVEHVADDVLETDGVSRNIRIFRNTARESLSGISLAQALDGPTWIVRNVLADCGLAKAVELEDYEGYPFKTNGGPSPEIGSGEVFFYHNTAFSRDPASRAVLVKSNVLWRKFTFRNNIWVGLGQGLDAWSSPLPTVDWDYDLLHTTGSPYAKIGATVYTELAALQAGAGILAHGLSTSPLFVDEQNADFHLTPSSPCRDVGVPLPGINESFAGTAPDMGAFEQ
jgi:parallel beta-helix repeat protein